MTVDEFHRDPRGQRDCDSCGNAWGCACRGPRDSSLHGGGQILFGRLLMFDLDYLYLFFAAPVFDLAVFGLFASNLALFGLVFAQLFVIYLLVALAGIC